MPRPAFDNLQIDRFSSPHDEVRLHHNCMKGRPKEGDCTLHVLEVGLCDYIDRNSTVHLILFLRVRDGEWKKARLEVGRRDNGSLEHDIYRMFTQWPIEYKSGERLGSQHWQTQDGRDALTALNRSEVLGFVLTGAPIWDTPVKVVNFGHLPHFSGANTGKLHVKLPDRRPISTARTLRDIILNN